MLKLKDKSLSVYKGNYRPVELFANAKKLHGFDSAGMSGEQAAFENTYNDYLTVYGKSGHIKGVNLIPPPENTSKNYTLNNETKVSKFTAKDDGRFDFKGANVFGLDISKVKLQPGTYTASGCKYVQIWSKEIGNFLTLPVTFTLKNEDDVYAYFWYTASTEMVLENQYIQIEEGETASDYTPYTGNFQYSVSPDNMHPIISASGSIRCEGANLIPTDFYDTSTWETLVDATGTRKIKFLDLAPGKYVFTFDCNLFGTSVFLYLQKQDFEGNATNVIRPVIGDYITKSMIFEVENGYRYRFWTWLFVENISLFSDFQIKRIETPNGIYKPEPIINAELPELRGIEVSNEDAYNYSETTKNGEKYYISDCLKGNILTRRIGEVVLTGNESVELLEGANENHNVFAIDLSDFLKNNKNFSPAICNFLKILSPQNAGEEGAVLGKNNKKLYLNLNKSKFANVNAVSNWLKAHYEGGSPLILFYVLDTPVTEQLNVEKTLKSYPKFTKIMVKNQNSQMPLGLSKIIKLHN